MSKKGEMPEKKMSIGDRVEWGTSQGATIGRVKKKLTQPIKIKGHQVGASPEKPEYLVETEKSRKLAAHKPGELKKATDKASGKKVSSEKASGKKISGKNASGKKASSKKGSGRKASGNTGS